MKELLKKLIAVPSLSGEEAGTAQIIYDYLTAKGVEASRFLNNVWAVNKTFSPGKPTLLLNSHHDTVQPSPAYARNPFEPTEENGRLYGLGSNDAGASVVSLIGAFCDMYHNPLTYNLVLAITAEEESICKNGISALWSELPAPDFAIVGEPTLMKAAVAERGLIVLDCFSAGISGHAARNEGDNALYKAVDDIMWFKNFRFPEISESMGEVKMTVTQINAGTQHNVIPAECRFVVDIRPTDKYANEEIVEIIRLHVKCEVKPRSLNLRASAISPNHVLAVTARELGIEAFISPTTSDISRIPVPALKMGPGNSARSHTADEYIEIDEISRGTDGYIEFLSALCAKI